MPELIERSVGLRLPVALYSRYAEQAESRQTDVESVLEERLSQAVEAHDSRPIYFSDDERREIDDLLGRNVRSASDILRSLRKSLTVKVSGTPVTLAPQLAERLASRNFTGHPFDRFLRDLVIECLERHVGMR